MKDNNPNSTSDQNSLNQLDNQPSPNQIREMMQRIGGTEGGEYYADDEMNLLLQQGIGSDTQLITAATANIPEQFKMALGDFIVSDNNTQLVVPLNVGGNHFTGLHIVRNNNNEGQRFRVTYFDPMGRNLEITPSQTGNNGILNRISNTFSGFFNSKKDNPFEEKKNPYKKDEGPQNGGWADEDNTQQAKRPIIEGSSIPNYIVQAIRDLLGVNPEDIIITNTKIQHSQAIRGIGNLTFGFNATNNHCGAFTTEILLALANEVITVGDNGRLMEGQREIPDFNLEQSNQIGRALRNLHSQVLNRQVLENEESKLESDLENREKGQKDNNRNKSSKRNTTYNRSSLIAGLGVFGTAFLASTSRILNNQNSSAVVMRNPLGTRGSTTNNQIISGNNLRRLGTPNQDNSIVLLSKKPTPVPTPVPTEKPKAKPTPVPTKDPTPVPTKDPTPEPTPTPTNQPSGQPTGQPNGNPTDQPTDYPSGQPTFQPSNQPTSQPTDQLTNQLSSNPTNQPSGQPSVEPTNQPSGQPSEQPSGQPSVEPTNNPSSLPTDQLSSNPTNQPSGQPSEQPSGQPSVEPTNQPSSLPTDQLSSNPTNQPSGQPSEQPSGQPSVEPTNQPSSLPTDQLSSNPTNQPSGQPSEQPSGQPSVEPTNQPSSLPTDQLSSNPTNQPSGQPSEQPSGQPSVEPTNQPSSLPTDQLSSNPTNQPSGQPSEQPSGQPSVEPTNQPSSLPTDQPSVALTNQTKSPTPEPTNSTSQILNTQVIAQTKANDFASATTIGVPLGAGVAFIAEAAVATLSASQLTAISAVATALGGSVPTLLTSLTSASVVVGGGIGVGAAIGAGSGAIYDLINNNGPAAVMEEIGDLVQNYLIASQASTSETVDNNNVSQNLNRQSNIVIGAEVGAISATTLIATLLATHYLITRFRSLNTSERDEIQNGEGSEERNKETESTGQAQNNINGPNQGNSLTNTDVEANNIVNQETEGPSQSVDIYLGNIYPSQSSFHQTNLMNETKDTPDSISHISKNSSNFLIENNDKLSPFLALFLNKIDFENTGFQNILSGFAWKNSDALKEPLKKAINTLLGDLDEKKQNIDTLIDKLGQDPDQTNGDPQENSNTKTDKIKDLNKKVAELLGDNNNYIDFINENKEKQNLTLEEYQQLIESKLGDQNFVNCDSEADLHLLTDCENLLDREHTTHFSKFAAIYKSGLEIPGFTENVNGIIKNQDVYGNFNKTVAKPEEINLAKEHINKTIIDDFYKAQEEYQKEDIKKPLKNYTAKERFISYFIEENTNIVEDFVNKNSEQFPSSSPRSSVSSSVKGSNKEPWFQTI